jgi:hypothetical protein
MTMPNIAKALARSNPVTLCIIDAPLTAKALLSRNKVVGVISEERAKINFFVRSSNLLGSVLMKSIASRQNFLFKNLIIPGGSHVEVEIISVRYHDKFKRIDKSLVSILFITLCDIYCDGHTWSFSPETNRIGPLISSTFILAPSTAPMSTRAIS